MFAYVALPPQNLWARLRQFPEYSEKDELPDPSTEFKFEYGPQRVDVFFTAEWTWHFYKAQVRSYIEIKPTLGQDYPYVGVAAASVRKCTVAGFAQCRTPSNDE